MKSERLMGLVFLLTLAAAAASSYAAWQAFSHVEIVVEWSTASELNTVGFNVFRGETKDGQVVQVNEDLIPASSEALSGSMYSFRDDHVDLGKTYYYYLDDLDADGRANRHGPVEVKADSNGWVLAGGAGLLFVIALLGRASQVSPYPKRTGATESLNESESS